MLLDTPEVIKDAVRVQEEALNQFHSELGYIISRSEVPTFFSMGVPNVPEGRWIAFTYYDDTAFFTVAYKDGRVFTKEITDPISDFVFTNSLLDLYTLTPVDKEDVIERIKKATSK